MKEREVLGINIRRFRLLNDLSRDELGKKVGLTETTIARLERGDEKYVKNIGLGYLIKLSDVLGAPMEELFLRNPTILPVRLVISKDNLEMFRKLLGQVEYLLQVKKKR